MPGTITIDYTITGQITVPEGTVLNSAGTGFILPSGVELNIGEGIRRYSPDGTSYRTLTAREIADEACAIGGVSVGTNIP